MAKSYILGSLAMIEALQEAIIVRAHERGMPFTPDEVIQVARLTGRALGAKIHCPKGEYNEIENLLKAIAKQYGVNWHYPGEG